MSIEKIITLFLYGSAIVGVVVSNTDIGKIKWMLWAILFLLAYIAGKLTP